MRYENVDDAKTEFWPLERVQNEPRSSSYEFLVHKNCTFSTLSQHISSRKIAQSETFFKELTLEPNLNLRICYQGYLGERTPEYDTSGWTCESLNPESLRNGEPIFSIKNTLRTSIDEINVACNLKKFAKYTLIP